MKHELAEILSRDFEFGGALVTIHEVDLTPDFKQAHVYVGIIGREDYQADAMHKLHQGAHAISQKLSKRVILKNTPILHFKHDDSVERGVRVLGIIEQIDGQVAPDDPPYPAARVPKPPQPKPKAKKSGRPLREALEDDDDDDEDVGGVEDVEDEVHGAGEDGAGEADGSARDGGAGEGSK